MNNILIFTDLHISKDSLDECIVIQDEIIALCNEADIDTVINCGDTFDSLKPSSQELDVFANFVSKLNRKLYIVVANSHESETPKESILNHFSILHPLVQTAKEFIFDDYLYCGHFIVKEAQINFGATKTKEDMKQYKLNFLGHSHHFEVIKPNVCQLGSSRFVSFDEAEDKQKVVALVRGYRQNAEKTTFVRLKSVYPMQVLLIGQSLKTAPINPPQKAFFLAEGQKTLLELDPKTKIKVKIQDFDTFKSYLTLEPQFQSKFVKYVRENDFELTSNNPEQEKDNKSLEENLDIYLKENNINSDVQQILREEIKKI